MQKLNLTKRQRGFTTVELIITVVLVSILILAVFGAASAMRRSFAQNTKNNYNLLAAKQGLSRIAEELRYASSMSTPPAPQGSSANSATFMVNNVSTTISLSGNSLQITKNGASPTPIPGTLVQSVTFTRNRSRVTVTMVVQDPSSATNPTLSLNSTVRMLNVSE